MDQVRTKALKRGNRRQQTTKVEPKAYLFELTHIQSLHIGGSIHRIQNRLDGRPRIGRPRNIGAISGLSQLDIVRKRCSAHRNKRSRDLQITKAKRRLEADRIRERLDELPSQVASHTVAACHVIEEKKKKPPCISIRWKLQIASKGRERN